MITDKMIEDEARETYGSDKDSGDSWAFYAFQSGAKFAQDKILEMASDGFEGFISKFQRSDMYSPRHMEKAYQAATIASEKKHQLEKEMYEHTNKVQAEWIAELEKEREEMKKALVEIRYYSGDPNYPKIVARRVLEELKAEK
jgi:hypothetical protein